MFLISLYVSFSEVFMSSFRILIYLFIYFFAEAIYGHLKCSRVQLVFHIHCLCRQFNLGLVSF